jgi:DNA polymerase delta subunit 1
LFKIVENTQATWGRAPRPDLNPSTDKLGKSTPSLTNVDRSNIEQIVFQQIEIDEYMDYNVHQPVVRFYGITAVSFIAYK